MLDTITKDIRMRGGVYIIRNRVSGRCYVGKTYRLSERFRDHMRKLRNSTHESVSMLVDWQRDGELAFEFVVAVVDDCEQSRGALEHACIATGEFGYNVANNAPRSPRRQEEVRAKRRSVLAAHRPARAKLVKLLQVTPTRVIAATAGATAGAVRKWASGASTPNDDAKRRLERFTIMRHEW